MKICLINNLYKPYNRGGAERIVDIVLNELSKEHEVFLISTSPILGKKDNNKIYYLYSCYYYLNKIPIFFRLFWHFWDMFDVVTCFKVYLILRKEKPDIILTHNLKGISYLLPQLINFLKIKHIHTLHDIQLLYPSGLVYFGAENIIDNFFAKFYQYITRLLFAPIRFVVSPSNWLMKEHEKRRFFRNAKHLTLLNPSSLKTEKRISENKDDIFRFIFIGQIEDHKGVELLINAFSFLNKKNIELIVIGDGSRLENIKKISKEYRNIIILGKKNSKETWQYLLNSDCLIMPSLCYENSPTVIYESIYARVPVIASAIGGNIELVGKYGGYLFQPGDANDLAKKMIKIIKNSPKGENLNEFLNKTDSSIYVNKLIKDIF